MNVLSDHALNQTINNFTILCFSHFASILGAARSFFVDVLSDHALNQTINNFINLNHATKV